MKSVALVFVFSLLLFAKEPIAPIPKKLPFDVKKAQLGKLLFFDPILSKDRTISCASCHDPDHGGADPRPVSIGIGGKKGRLNSPTVYNAIFNFRQFWNGRAKDLSEQIDGPLHNPVEMGMSNEEVVARLNASAFYRSRFEKIYHRKKITYAIVKDAIVAFEKALITPDCKFDRYLRGEVKLSEEEKRGYIIFKKIGCITCHNGINIGGNSFQKIGTIIPYRGKIVDDLFALTHNLEDRGKYKVPTLRNIALTAPYFHDGSVATLEMAIDKMSYHNLGFNLTKEEKRAILAFLRTLTGKKPAILEANEN